MNKKYRLLKDLPDCAAGSIFTYDGNHSYDYETAQCNPSWYHKVVVENTPSWWEEVKEPERIIISHLKRHDSFKDGGDSFWYQFCASQPLWNKSNEDIIKAIENVINIPQITKEETKSNDSFQWTDDLVLEFIRFTDKIENKFTGYYTDIDNFKQSKTPKPQADSDIEFIRVKGGEKFSFQKPKVEFYEHTPQAENKPDWICDQHDQKEWTCTKSGDETYYIKNYDWQTNLQPKGDTTITEAKCIQNPKWIKQ